MKKTRKLLALVMAFVMVMAMASTAFADGENTSSDGKYTITINNTATGHTYEAYQIFTGDLDPTSGNDNVDGTSAVLSNIKWGNGVNQDGLIAALKNGVDIMKDLDGTATAADVAKILSGQNYNSDAAKQFAEVISKHLSSEKATSTENKKTDGEKEVTQNYTISSLEPGYYLVKDQNGSLAGDHDAYTSYIIEVVEDSTVSPKSAIPSVDKQVLDEVDDAEAGSTGGWGETADHAINETFKFKLIATLSADTDFAAYETYKVVFTDTMSAGITFESIVSVKVDDQTLTTGYTCTADAGQAGGFWTLTIDNIKGIANVDLTDGATIEVIYNAHLNENAKIANEKENKNTVNLQYSNNPNAGGENELGKTPDDHVWVFTYEIDATKIDGATKEALEGATFAIKNNDGKYYGGIVDGVVTWVESEDPVTDAAVYKVTSNEDGVFTVKGLDVGTYILTEIVTPPGYNTCADVTVVISAVHAEKSETEAETVITMTKDNAPATEITVENNKGATLPETGGVGTTIFYAVGGALVLAAIVLLISKKRMASEE